MMMTMMMMMNLTMTVIAGRLGGRGPQGAREAGAHRGVHQEARGGGAALAVVVPARARQGTRAAQEGRSRAALQRPAG